MAESIHHSRVIRNDALGRFLEKLSEGMAWLAGGIFIAEAVMSVVSVIGRALWNTPVLGDYEIVQVLSAMGIALCLPYCQLRAGHVFVDFFTLRVPRRFNRILDYAALLLLALAAFLVAWRVWAGLLDIKEYGETSMVIGIPIWWGYVPLVWGFAVLGLVALYDFSRAFNKDV
ncbi:TRAP transporter small permease [Thiofilum flexile]|uniref:TRAP transporter small permease n=1 Tax=Thiofilum flexile TaxID=125627 RepID=UPI0003624400|nr:TRAP transporter small permease [Thiofilum flexile]